MATNPVTTALAKLNPLGALRRHPLAAAAIAPLALVGLVVATTSLPAPSPPPRDDGAFVLARGAVDGSTYPGAQWARAAAPEALGWSAEKLAEARAYSRELGSSAVVIVDRGVVVDAWGDLTKTYQCRSMRKSFLSALYGRPVEEGLVRLDATLAELGVDDEPPLTPAEKRATVFDLLTARSGVYHPANFESSGMRRKRPNRGSEAPGERWFFNNWDFNALGTIYEEATGERVFDAFDAEIAKPIGMERFSIEDTQYHRGDDSVHPAYRFRMSPLDAARFGLLMARGGVWNGERVVSAAWLRRSTRAYVDTGRQGFHAGYGFMWWVGDDGFAAVGARGQRIFVMPSRDIVVAHFVDADVDDLRVRTSDIRRLLQRILDAKIGDGAKARAA
ncbi:MAG: serine hydrolase domain-containing protein [Parvularculaceae bacterium]